MFNWKHALGILCAFSLVATAPTAPAKAGSYGGVAAGVVGAVAGAIIMNQMMQAQRPNGVPSSRPKTAHHRKSETSGEAANAKDPFAGKSAPAGYATPVTDSK
jgi:hypothetical protein